MDIDVIIAGARPTGADAGYRTTVMPGVRTGHGAITASGTVDDREAAAPDPSPH
ncbi:hypothetical protein [Streptomyces prunicolor]|uniref:hypothetical protein n=1 Tax=Streptomyces prunicolor TaxID=67348 RepID=UPI0003A2551F|nr:hypothetical protein [Streptomyces prunicolor]